MTTRDCPTGLERLPLRKTARYLGTFRYSGLELLVALALLFLATPFIQGLTPDLILRPGRAEQRPWMVSTLFISVS